MSKIRLGVSVAMVLILLPLAAAQVYTVTDLGVLPGGFASTATSINDGGEIAGFSEDTHFTNHAFVWTPASGLRDLGTLGGVNSFAWGINNEGQVVGQSETSNSSRAFLWTSSGGMQDLGTLGGISSGASAISNKGQIVGSSSIAGDSNTHAFLWSASTGMQDLGSIGGRDSAATAINDNGEVVGYFTTTTDFYAHSFVWTQSGGMQQIDPPDTRSSQAWAINAFGAIAGYDQPQSSFTSKGFVRSPSGEFMNIGSLGTEPNIPKGMSSTLQVVGQAESFGFLLTHAGGLQDLNDLVSGQYGICRADAINRFGQIAATGAHALLLSPIQ